MSQELFSVSADFRAIFPRYPVKERFRELFWINFELFRPARYSPVRDQRISDGTIQNKFMTIRGTFPLPGDHIHNFSADADIELQNIYLKKNPVSFSKPYISLWFLFSDGLKWRKCEVLHNCLKLLLALHLVDFLRLYYNSSHFTKNKK